MPNNDFFKYDTPVFDPVLDAKLNEFRLYSNQLLEEIRRIEGKLSSLKNAENELVQMEEEIVLLRTEKSNILELLDSSEKKIKSIQEENIALENNLLVKKEELLTYEDLHESISKLRQEKEDILLFIRENSISKDEKKLLTEQLTLLRSSVLDLETKHSQLNREIIEKEETSRRLDRDLEEPKKILEEAKYLEQVGKSSLEAAQKIKEDMENTQGTIGSYIKKLQKKYPDIDFML